MHLSIRVARLAIATLIATMTWSETLGAQSSPKSDPATIYIYRPDQFAGIGLSVNVHVDGKSVGSINNAGCLRVRVAAGQHTVSGGNMWGGIFSGGGHREVRVNAGPGTSTHVLITPSMSMPSYSFTFPATITPTGPRC